MTTMRESLQVGAVVRASCGRRDDVINVCCGFSAPASAEWLLRENTRAQLVPRLVVSGGVLGSPHLLVLAPHIPRVLGAEPVKCEDWASWLSARLGWSVRHR